MNPQIVTVTWNYANRCLRAVVRDDQGDLVIQQDVKAHPSEPRIPFPEWWVGVLAEFRSQRQGTIESPFSALIR